MYIETKVPIYMIRAKEDLGWNFEEGQQKFQIVEGVFFNQDEYEIAYEDLTDDPAMVQIVAYRGSLYLDEISYRCEGEVKHGTEID